LKKEIHVPRWIWVPPTVYIGLYWLGNRGMLVRHILPIYPFLILFAAKAFLWFWRICRSSQFSILRGMPFLFLLGCPLSVLGNYPNYIAYTNEFMAGDQKANLLSSFNWSLGQDVKRLAETAQKRKWRKVKFISKERTDPYFYGLKWEPWSLMDLHAAQPGTVYIVDLCSVRQDPNYYAVLFRKDSWLNFRAPTGNIGDTLEYYEVPGKPFPDHSPKINSFPYYLKGVRPYLRDSKTNPIQVE